MRARRGRVEKERGSKMSRSKADFISDLSKVLKVKEDFKKLEYKRSAGNEYLFLSVITGHVFIFDITGYTDERIYHTLALIECGVKPKSQVTEPKELVAIAKLCG